VFEQLKSDVERARAKQSRRQQKKFVARALEVKPRQVTGVFETNGGEGLVAYFARDQGKVWLQFVGYNGALYGEPIWIGNYADGGSHMAKAAHGDGWEWRW
jgi:hypothetical protein